MASSQRNSTIEIAAAPRETPELNRHQALFLPQTGLDHVQIRELVARIHQLRPPTRRGRPQLLGLYRQVQLTLVLVRQNLSQTLVADLYEVSQSTVSRIYRTVLPLIEQVTSCSPASLSSMTWATKAPR